MAGNKKATATPAAGHILLGHIAGVYGVQGWVKIYSHTKPVEQILQYSPWQLYIDGQWQTREIVNGRKHGKGVVVQLAGLNDRDEAKALNGTDIAIAREQLPPTEADEYYWTDLVGLNVVNTEGLELGVVDHLFETGANDVMVVKGEQEYLIPFVQPDYITDVDLQNRKITVYWLPEFS